MTTTKMFGLLLPLASLLCLVSSQLLEAQQRTSSTRNYVGNNHAVSASDRAGIHEVIDQKYEKRYQEWKDEFLSTDIGKAQWEMYLHHPRLVLTITITG